MSSETVTTLLRELAETSKRVLIMELKTGPKTVGQLVEASGLKQPNVSNHLARLKRKGVLKDHKVGRQVYYSLNGPDVEAAVSGLIAPRGTAVEPIPLDFETVKRFSRLAVAGDEQSCIEILDSLIQSEVPLVDIYEKLFAHCLGLVGDWWMVQAIDEGQEHLASAIVERLMARAMHYAPVSGRNAGVALIGCAQGNWHSIGARMVSDVMRLESFKVFYLGANVPHRAFLSALADHQPNVVMISCATEDHLDATYELIAQMRAERKSGGAFSIGVGGRALGRHPELALDHGADFVASDLGIIRSAIVPLVKAGELPSGVFRSSEEGSH